jgi:hypothetical protein
VPPLLLFAALLLGLSFGLAAAGLPHPQVAACLGLLSALCEINITVPQFVANYTQKTVKGLSLGLVGSWLLGDLFKIYLYQQEDMGLAIVLGAFVQLAIDLAIVAQIVAYSRSQKED